MLGEKLYVLTVLLVTCCSFSALIQAKADGVRWYTGTSTISPPHKLVDVRPEEEAKINNYTFRDCISAQFGAYMDDGNGRFIQLENGIVDQSRSTCFNDSDPDNIIEPRMVMNFGNNAWFSLGLGSRGSGGVVWEGNLIDKGGFSSQIVDCKPQPCIYHESHFEEALEVGRTIRGKTFVAERSTFEVGRDEGLNFMLINLRFEVHRGVQQPFNKCA